MRTFDAASLRSLPVIATSEGRVLGRVKDALFDPQAHHLIGVLVSARGRGGGAALLDRARIRSLGPFAVTTASGDDLQPLETHGRAQAVAASRIHLQGAPVLAEDGERIGSVRRIWVSDDGEVERYESASGPLAISGRFSIEPAQVLAIGEDAMVVSNEVRDQKRRPAQGRAGRAPSEKRYGTIEGSRR